MQMYGYVRRSTSKQAMSPETQRRRLRLAAEASGWDLVLREEDAASAKTLAGRPVLAATLADLRAGRGDGVAVAALDRIARSTKDFAGMLDQADAEGWSLVCLDLGVDTSTDNGRLVAEIRASVASWERRLIASRTREGMATIRATTGKHMGRPSRIPADVEARIVALHDAGQSASAIARRFNDEGVPKGTGSSPLWNHSHVVAAVRREQVRRRAGT